MENTNPDIKRMKQEAIKYVNDMKSKSKFSHDGSYPKPPHSDNTPSDNFDKENNNVCKDKYDKPKLDKTSPVSDILDVIMKDKEKTIILALILILMNEGADTSLILALMYLLI